MLDYRHLRKALTSRQLCRWFGLGKRKWDWVEDVTGPPMLLQSVKAYNATLGLAHVKILEPGIIFPIDWRYTSQDWKNAGVLIKFPKESIPVQACRMWTSSPLCGL